MKKGLFFALGMLGVTLLLNGCATGTVIKKEDDRYYNYKVKASNYDKITAKNINLTFEIKPGAPTGEFNWKDVTEAVTEAIEAKGITISDSGTPVTIRLDYFLNLDPDGAYYKGYDSGISGGSVLALGGSIAQGVTASLAENFLTEAAEKDKQKKEETKGPKLCKSSQCVPDVSYTIISNDYQSNVRIYSVLALNNPVSSGERITIQSIPEMFESAK